MLYLLLYPHASGALRFLNVLRYVPFRVLLSTLTSMALTFGLYPRFIEMLKRRQIGQVVRSDGPTSHFSKAGTPTMGGALILFALLLGTVLWADVRNMSVLLTCGVTLAYGLLGYADDAAKIEKKNSGGVKGRIKLVVQFGVALAVCGYLFYGQSGLSADWLANRYRLAMPFLAYDRHPIELAPWLYVIFGAFVLAATSNGVNLTDGLDGLAIGPVMINAGTYAILAYLAGLTLFGQSMPHYLHIAPLASASELAVFCGAVVGAGFGFLWYNTYPAQIFMGDVGSLSLGGAIGMLALLTKNEFLSIVLGGIFFLESVSVIGQVASFKLTGKRIFLMAPIHHHFEKKGWPEPRVIVRFWIVSIILAILSLASLKLR